jgi:hypothetical protein
MPAEQDRQFATGSASVANALASAAINGAVGKRCYCTGITLIMGGATAANNVDATLVNVPNTPMHFAVDVPTPVGSLPFTLTKNFSPPLPATLTNNSIQLNMPAGGAGNVEASVTIEGFLLPEP